MILGVWATACLIGLSSAAAQTPAPGEPAPTGEVGQHLQVVVPDAASPGTTAGAAPSVPGATRPDDDADSTSGGTRPPSTGILPRTGSDWILVACIAGLVLVAAGLALHRSGRARPSPGRSS